MKTGYIRASGYNLVTTAKRDGHRLVGVIFGGNTARTRDRHMQTLLNRTYAKLRAERAGSHTNKKKFLNKSRKMGPKVKDGTKMKGSVWGIQVGAFYTRKPAVAIAKILFDKHPKLLGRGQIAIMPLHKTISRTLYRARILGISMRSAYRACRILKKRRQPCMPLRLPGNIEIASR